MRSDVPVPDETRRAAPARAPSVSRWYWPVFFGAVLLIHFLLVTQRWSAGDLRGHEFRQTQTAISAYFIQAENNFSLAYPTPLFGKPWSVPMEFPLYQWAVVGLSNWLNLPLAPAGRTVSLACFYLTLPALFLLLARFGTGMAARWLSLSLVVTCPLYIFYTRAFLIESMALMFAAWFLTAFVAGMQTGRLGWIILAAVAGSGAALVKVTTLMIWMMPAAALGLWFLYDSRARGGRAVLETLGRGAALAAAPCAAALWWVKTADEIKALNPTGRFLMSDSMRGFNFGSWTDRLSKDIWGGILANWNIALMPGWLTLGLLATLLLAPVRWRVMAMSGLAALLAALLMLPRLFTLHDYYFYAAGVFWLGAAGVAGQAWLARLPRAAAAIIVVVVLAVQLNTYRLQYYGFQSTSGVGGSHLTEALKDLTPREGVLIVAGNDWSAMLPYFAQRRALMFRGGLEADEAAITAAFAGLAGEEVAALLVTGGQRNNSLLIDAAVKRFDLHPEIAFSYFDTDVYLPRERRDWTVAKLWNAPVFGRVVPHGERPAHPVMPPMDHRVKTVNPSADRGLFGHMSPMPVRYHFSFDPNIGVEEGRLVYIGAHPDSEMWFVPPAGMREINVAFGLMTGAYERTGAATDGVDFIIIEKRSDGIENVIYRRPLQPSTKPEDRGRQQVVVPCHPAPGSELVFLTRPNGTYAFDWAYWGPITLR